MGASAMYRRWRSSAVADACAGNARARFAARCASARLTKSKVES